MNTGLMILEIGVVVLGLALLLVDLWTPVEKKRQLGYYAAGAVGLLFVGSFWMQAPEPQYAFGGMFVQDGLALFFKRFFLLAAVIVLVMSVEFADRIESAISEYYVLILFALAGMLFAASTNDFILMFVALELITVTFYVLTSFERRRVPSLEAGVKYLILGALASAFMVYGIALIFGAANSTKFDVLAAAGTALMAKPVFLLGLLLMLAGLGFKLAAFPFQVWAPDVYQGAPVPTTAFLAVGSKAAGVVLLLRVLFSAVPEVTVSWAQLLMVISAITILYGNLCAIPQRSLKRLMGYSSIAHAGYILLGIAAMSLSGSSAILYYLGGYLFTVLAAFTVVAVVIRELDGDDISAFSGLHERSPLLAAALALAMISLAGIPPLAGFFGKFLLLRALVERGDVHAGYYWLIAAALLGVVISFYYYLGVVRAIYWGKGTADRPAIRISPATQWSLYGCIAGMFYLGIFPNQLLKVTAHVVQTLRF